MAEEKIILTSCIHDCGGRCPLKVYVKDGIVTRIENCADEEDLLRGCLRGRAYRQVLYNPNRLKYPMKRKGERGQGKFKRISWDEALDTVANELKRVKETYGNSSILYGGSGSNGAVHRNRVALRLLNMFGGCTTTFCSVSYEGALFSSMVSYGDINTGTNRADHLNWLFVKLCGNSFGMA